MVHDRPLAEMDPVTLYRVLQLRSEVFVVEQACLFLDLDGRDLEGGCRQLWVESGDGEVVAAARVLDEGAARRIGRIVTRARARREGLAAALVDHFLARYPGPWLLDAQSHLTGWYERRGFVVCGEEYVEDGIPHIPMRRDAR